MHGTVAPGKQRVIALKKQMFLVMESPIIRVVGGKSGRGETGEESPRSAEEGNEGDSGSGDVTLAGGDGRAVAGAHRGAGVNCGMERRRVPGRVGRL